MICIMDKKRIEAAVREILIAVGENPDRQGLLETPRRVADMYEEIFAGLEENPGRHLKLFDEDKNDEMVTVRDIPLYSVCEHHLVPFLQERLTAQIADFLEENINPQGVAVIIEAEHLCMTMRGARAAGCRTQTSALRGRMKSDARARSEALALLASKG